MKELDAAGLLERERRRLLRTQSALCQSAASATVVRFSDQLMAGKVRPSYSRKTDLTDGRKTDPMMVGKPSPNQTTINNLTREPNKGSEWGAVRSPMADMENIFLSQTEYDELQAEYPDRLERFIEEMSRYLAANGKSLPELCRRPADMGGERQKGSP